MKKIVVLISGGGSNLEAIAKACQIGNIPATIELVISNRSNVKGLERAKKFHLMSKVIEHQNLIQEKSLISRYERYLIEPDLVVRRVYADSINRFYKNSKWKINQHPSLPVT